MATIRTTLQELSEVEAEIKQLQATKEKLRARLLRFLAKEKKKTISLNDEYWSRTRHTYVKYNHERIQKLRADLRKKLYERVLIPRPEFDVLMNQLVAEEEVNKKFIKKVTDVSYSKWFLKHGFETDDE